MDSVLALPAQWLEKWPQSECVVYSNSYIEKYQEVAEEGLNPWLHFMLRGFHEGRTWAAEVVEIHEGVIGQVALNGTLETEASKWLI